ncbi:MAG: HDIG domain-containing protein [Planctomycetaceae bacterium]|nr:HDIG domain-containing protein [Planctomycetaceae bacterium]
MAILAPKRPRQSRTARMRPAPQTSSRFDELLRDQSLLLRWMLGIGTVIALALVVEAWKAPFPYREGDYEADGIAARIGFQREDQYRTERARDDMADDVNPVFTMKPETLDPLPGQLRQDLEAVAKAERLDDLPAETRNALGFTVPEGADADVEAMQRDFEALKAAVGVPADPEGNPVDKLVKSFEALVAEMKTDGIITVDELKRNSLRTDGDLNIVRPGQTIPERVPNSQVLLGKILLPEGKIGRQLERDPQLKPIAPIVRRWLTRKAVVSLRYESTLTQEARRRARSSVETVYNSYLPRDILVQPRSRITENDLEILRIEYAEIDRRTTVAQRIARAVTVVMMLGVLTVLNGYYFYRSERQLFGSAVRLGVYLAAVLVALALARLLSFDPWRAEVIPLIAVVTVMAIAYDQVLATITAFSLTALLVLSTTGDLGHFVVLMAVASAAVIPLSAIDSRSKLIKIGFLTAFVYFVVSVGLGFLERQALDDIWTDTELFKRSMLGAGWCLVASYLVAGSLPFVENLFGVVTDISLLEMTDVSHPLLQELVRRAPGTYNHSMAVATIGETAADAIGANGLLVRVGAYFHDVGKMLKPHYFVENMTEGQQSRHDQLAPAMSTLIIIGHVKDGVDLAREHNLPRRVIDFVEQHHGTTLVEYFYREATRLADATLDHKADAEESAFRYPGPKPRSKETGVIMLADAVESASRTLTEPTPKRIESLVRGISLKRLLDGQFDESGLTLNEIRRVEDSLIKSLIGIYHGRIKYPDQKQD